MNSLSCKICCNRYGDSTKPRFLPCGHCCCTPCLSQILGNGCCCFLCKQALTEPDVEKYPVIYTILDIAEEFSNSSLRINNLKFRLESLMKSLDLTLTLASKEVDATKNIFLKWETAVSLLNTNKGKVQKFLDGYQDLDVDDVYREVEEIEKLMIDAKNELNSNNIPVCTVDYKVSKLENSTKYLIKIHDDIMNNRKFVFAYKIIDGENKFARISVSDNKLLLHAFSSSAIDDIDLLVKFEDLWKAFPKGQQLQAFLSFKTRNNIFQRIYIDCLYNFFSTILFLQLCTAEFGSTYKGGRVRRVNARNTDTIYVDFVKNSSSFDLFNYHKDFSSNISDPSVEISGNSREWHVILTPSREIQISKFAGEYPYIIGRVSNFEAFLSCIDTDAKLLDCGVAITLQ